MSARPENARSATVETAAVYALKLWLAGVAAAVFLPLALAAAAVDVVRGRGPDAGLLGRVLAFSAAVEARVDVHGPLTDIRLADRPRTSVQASTASPRTAGA